MSSKEATAGSNRAAHVGARRSTLAALLIAAALATAALGFSAAPALAATTDTFFVVASGGSTTSTCQSFDSPCTLAAALSQATSGSYSGDNAIIVLGSGIYTNSDYAITGGSLNQLTLQGESDSPVGTALYGNAMNTPLTVDATYQVSVLELTLEDGGGAGPGADLLDDGTGTVAFNDDLVNGGLTSPANTGLVEATAGYLSVADTTIEGGGANMIGVESSGGGVGVEYSTITGESVGAAALGTGELSITDSTLDDNTIGVLDQATGTVGVTDSTVSGSSTAGIANVGSDAIDLGWNILANAASLDGNCTSVGGPLYDLGYNVTDDGTCGFGTADGNIVTSTGAIGLLSLASNGGLTQTQRITATSAAYDVVPDGTNECVAGGFDQRGAPSLQPGASGCDAGAYQVAPPTLTSITSSAAEPRASITLTGTNLQSVTGATFGTGNTAATITAQANGALTVTVPMLATGAQPITVTGPDGTATIGFTVTAGPTITTTSLPSAEVGQPYSATLAASGGASPLEFGIAAGALPAGLTLSLGGTVSGTPTGASSSTFTVAVVDGYGVSSMAGLSLTVSAAPVAATVTPPLATPTVAPPVATPTVTPPVRIATVKIESTGIKLQRRSGKVKLACDTAPCAGRMEIVKTFREKLKQGKRTVEETKTLMLAGGSYRLASGRTESFAIKLTTIGRKDLRASAAKPLHETLLITVTGGRTERRTVELS